MEIKNGFQVVAGSTDEQEVELHKSVQTASPVPLFYIVVVSGTIQFASDTAIEGDHYAWPAGSQIPMTVKNKLHFKAASALDTFVVTI